MYDAPYDVKYFIIALPKRVTQKMAQELMYEHTNQTIIAVSQAINRKKDKNAMIKTYCITGNTVE